MWSQPFETSAGLITDPVIVGEGEDAVLIVGGIGQELFGLDPATGEEVWEKPFEGDNWFWGRPARGGDTGEVLFFPNLDHKVYAVDGKTGTAVWENPFKAEEAIHAAPVMIDDLLAVVDRKGNVFSLDPASAEPQLPGPTRLGTNVLADPLEFDDGMLILGTNGSLQVVDPTANGFSLVQSQ
jgi:outer membrane protein assembly factor BamB